MFSSKWNLCKKCVTLSDFKKARRVMLSDFWLRRAKNCIEAYVLLF